MALEWTHSIDGVDWEELSALYRVAPLGNKKPSHLQTVFFQQHVHVLCVRQRSPRRSWSGTGRRRGLFLHLRHRSPAQPSRHGPGKTDRQSTSSRGLAGTERRSFSMRCQVRSGSYKKFGFLRMKTAMAIFENQQQQLERGYLSEG